MVEDRKKSGTVGPRQLPDNGLVSGERAGDGGHRAMHVSFSLTSHFSLLVKQQFSHIFKRPELDALSRVCSSRRTRRRRAIAEDERLVVG